MIKVGKLCYVPQDVVLMQFDEGKTSPKAYYKTDKPQSVVVVGESDRSLGGNFIEVFCNGQKWCVDRTHLFEMRE